jgi:hypothetical protein
VRLRDPIWRFALRALAWLAPCFVLWYLAAPWYDRPAGWLARIFIDLWRDGVVDSVEYQARLVTFVTSLEVQSQGGIGRLVLEVNPLLYGFGAPLLAALLLASRAPWTKIALGLVVLIPFQAWGIAFDALTQVLRDAPGLAPRAGLSGLRAEVAALAYQLGSLILPTLVPVVLWVVWQRPFIEAELLSRAAAPSPPPPSGA